MAEERLIRVKAGWCRPRWCRDDWCLISLPNGYRYYSPNAAVEFADGDECWVRARHLWDIGDRRGVEVKFVDYDGEGSLDSISLSQVRPEGRGEEEH